MDIKELNKDYLDLYGDVLGVIVLNEPPTFETIKKYFKPTEQTQKEFDYNGKSVVAKRKVVYQHYQLKSNYLHILIEDRKYSNGVIRYSKYREQKDGTFKFMGYYNDSNI